MNIWIISDTHFYHEKIKKYHNRPDDIEEQIFTFWNKNIKENDLLIHLGDIVWKREGELFTKLKTMPGRKILVRGNHDYHSNRWYIERVFDFACDSFLWYYRLPQQSKKNGFMYLFSHRPVPTKTREFDFNIHGHLHVKENSHREGEVKLKPWHLSYLVEETDWMPTPFDNFIFPLVKHKIK